MTQANITILHKINQKALKLKIIKFFLNSDLGIINKDLYILFYKSYCNNIIIMINIHIKNIVIATNCNKRKIKIKIQFS